MDATASTPDAKERVERLLDEAAARRASDIHFDPAPDGFRVRYRLDGLLEEVAQLSEAEGRACVTRLMVMAQLLTYRPDIPQEGRMEHAGHELRISVIPTAHGIRGVVRLPAELTAAMGLTDLCLGERVEAGLRRFAECDAGMLLVTGPAGSGKTTTIYALLAHIVRTQPGLSVVALEDPVERTIPGVTQIEVAPHGALSYERALKSILRQDPQVLMLGEVRDRDTASLAVQAALSGHRLIATLHAGSPAGAIARLVEMGIESYQITSSLFGVLSQRLLRKRHAEGYCGRTPIAELAQLTPALRADVLKCADLESLRCAIESDPAHESLRSAALRAVQCGLTDENEAARVLGPDWNCQPPSQS